MIASRAHGEGEVGGRVMFVGLHSLGVVLALSRGAGEGPITQR